MEHKIHSDEIQDEVLEVLWIELVEGGAEVIWSFLKSRLADEMCIFIGSLIIGGKSSPTPASGEGASSLEDTVELILKDAEVLGDGVVLEYEVAK